MASSTIKLYPVSTLRRRSLLLGTAVGLLGLAGIMQARIDPDTRQFHQGEADISRFSGGLNNEFLLLPLLGFREAAAGLLWVRCDEFFHSGDYDAILPLVRLITLLDPHAENVYITGAWHMSYNFTDSSERSDRRYLSPSEALLDEGIRNNPGPDIKFEKAWENYDKIKNFVEAEGALKLAINGKPMRGSDDYPYAAPLKALHLLAHAYEKQGRIPEALDEWLQAIARSNQMTADDAKANRRPDYSNKQLHDSEVHNYNETLQRYRNRYTTSGHDKVNPTPFPAVLAPPAGSTQPQPWNVAFHPSIEVVRPKVFKIKGRFNSADGSRIDVRVTDWNYADRPITGVINSFQVDYSQTILVDSIAVRKGNFEREMDMSKDPKMYSFSQPYYRITLSYNPRTTSPHLHDRFGWSGEGLTDEKPQHVYLDTNAALLGTTLISGQGGADPAWDGKTVPWAKHGQPPRLIRVVYKVSKEQVQDEKPITDADIVSAP